MLLLAVGAGADSNSVDVDGSASSMWAAYLGDTGVVKMLLDAGTDTLLRGYDAKLAGPFTIDRGDEKVVLPVWSLRSISAVHRRTLQPSIRRPPTRYNSTDARHTYQSEH